MDTVGAYEAKTHLPKLLERVAKGEHITITKHGIPVAVIRPFDPDKNTDVRAIIDKLIQFRKRKNLSGYSSAK